MTAGGDAGVSVDGALVEYLAVPATALADVVGLEPSIAATAVVIGVAGPGRMAVQILRTLTAARTVVLDIRPDVLSGSRSRVDLAWAADEPDAVGDAPAATGGYGAEVVIDPVGNDDTRALVDPYGDGRAIGRPEGRFTFETSRGAQPLRRGVTITRPDSGSCSDLVDAEALAPADRLRPAVEPFPSTRPVARSTSWRPVGSPGAPIPGP